MDNLKKIYEEYMTQVYRYLFSLCHDPHLAEELTQETFFRVLKSINQFRGDCKLYIWLCQVAKHVWVKEMKHRGKVETMVEKTVKAENEHEELLEDRVIIKRGNLIKMEGTTASFEAIASGRKNSKEYKVIWKEGDPIEKASADIEQKAKRFGY